MSTQTVELVRQIYEVFATRGPEAAGEYLDVNIEWLPPIDAPTAGTYRGIEQVKAQLADWTGQFSGYAWEPQDFISAPEGRVVVIGQQHGRGVVSGVDVEEGAVHVWTVREGKAIRLEMYRSREEALEAMGLRE
jgi:ketosteroid isomerase-like protein